MSTRTNKKRVQILPLMLAFQLFLPAQAFAEEETDSAKNRQLYSDTATALQFIDGIGHEYIQAHQQRMMQQRSMQAAQQLNQTLGIKPVDPSQVPPIIAQNGCMVLQARTEQISSGMSCKGAFDMNVFQSGHYDALLQVAEQNVNSLENFLTQGHERFTTQGLGCYDKAKNQLSQQLNARLEMLEQMKQSIDERINAFKKLAENDLKDIKKGDALLNGKTSDKETAAAMKDFKWEDKFNDPACKTLVSDFNSTGSKAGFRGIEESLSKNKDALGAENFFSKKNQYEKEIRKIASEASRQVRREEGIPKADQVLSGIRTRDFSTSSSSLVQSFNIVAKKAANKQEDLTQELQKVVGQEKDLQGFASAIVKDTADVEKALAEWEKAEKNKCFQKHFASEFGSVKGFLDRIEDPNISRKANREADNAFKNYIAQILNDDRFTVQEKMQKIAAKQAESNNSRYGLVSGRSFTVQGKQVGASTRLRAKDMVNLFGNECRQAFESDDRAGGHSGREMVNALKNYATEHKKAKQEFASALQTEIISGMIDCPDQQSVGKSAKSCGPDSTNINKPGFCVRTANACSANALSCLDKAKKIVKQTRSEQQAIAKRYKANMDKLKADLIAEFKSVKGNFEASSRQIDGLFQMGTMFKKDEKPMSEQLVLNFTTDDKSLMADVDPSLAIEDPDKYKAKIVANIDSLKKQVEGHNGQILAAYDDEIEKYQNNYKSQLNQWKSVAQNCAKKIGPEYSRFVDEHNRREQESANASNEKVAEACNKYKNFKSNPCPSGSGSEFGELGNDIAAIATTVNDSQAADEIRGVVASCDAFSNEDGSQQYFGFNNDGSSASSKFNISLNEFCEEGGVGDTANVRACSQLRALEARGITADSSESFTCETNEAFREGTEGDKGLCVKNNGANFVSESECQGENDMYIAEHSAAMANDKAKSFLEALAGCDSLEEDHDSDIAAYEAAEEEALNALAQYKRQEFNNEVGEITVAACEGGNNADPSMPDFTTPEGARALAGQLFGAGAAQY